MVVKGRYEGGSGGGLLCGQEESPKLSSMTCPPHVSMVNLTLIMAISLWSVLTRSSRGRLGPCLTIRVERTGHHLEGQEGYECG